MALRRVFVDQIEGGEAVVRGGAAHHLARVARLRPGERVEVSDQTAAYSAVAKSCSPAEIRLRIGEPVSSPAAARRINAALAIIKFARFEWAVEKLTELGVHSIVPLVAARSSATLARSAARRAQRWRRIALEAAQQARRLAPPDIAAPASFEDAVGNCRAATRLLASPGGAPLRLAPRGSEVTLLVGPEGGWTAAEVDLAGRHGFETAGLGATILRSETAAVAAAAICACGGEGGDGRR